MTTINFFTPILHKDPKTCIEQMIDGVEDYFTLGGRKVYEITGKWVGKSREVALHNIDKNKIGRVILGAIKIISYMTVVLPLIMLMLKLSFRESHKFHIKKAERQIPVAQEILGTKRPEKGTTADLMNTFTKAWNSQQKSFEFSSKDFNLGKFTEQLEQHAQQFKKEGINHDHHFGYIEKFDLKASDNPQIYMRADLHGDLKSLIENLRSLKEQGLLDDQYKCRPGVHLVFLGDYCDRGQYGTQILQMLMKLREENPNQVHLIRGNHESTDVNRDFGGKDDNLMRVLDDDKANEALQKFYETMSLTSYFSVNDGDKREYVQCTHGLFELTMDPAPLLDQTESQAFIPVTRERRLSDRIRKIAEGNSPLAESAKRIAELVETKIEPWFTVYNWGDVTESETTLGPLGNRQYKLSAKDIRHYFDLSSEQHKVMMLFRGHQHGFQHIMLDDKVIATTLPVGMDCPAYQRRFNQPDRAYIITPKSKVENWQKRAILREAGKAITDQITEAVPLTSNAV